MPALVVVALNIICRHQPQQHYLPSTNCGWWCHSRGSHTSSRRGTPSPLPFLNLPLPLFNSIWNIIKRKNENSSSSSSTLDLSLLKHSPLSFIIEFQVFKLFPLSVSLFTVITGLRELLLFMVIISKIYMFYKFDPAHLLFNCIDEFICNHTNWSFKHCSNDKNPSMYFFLLRIFGELHHLCSGNSINLFRKEIKNWFFFMCVMCFCWWYDIGSWNVLSCF